jgi:hypothetical protein
MKSHSHVQRYCLFLCGALICSGGLARSTYADGVSFQLGSIATTLNEVVGEFSPFGTFLNGSDQPITVEGGGPQIQNVSGDPSDTFDFVIPQHVSNNPCIGNNPIVLAPGSSCSVDTHFFTQASGEPDETDANFGVVVVTGSIDCTSGGKSFVVSAQKGDHDPRRWSDSRSRALFSGTSRFRCRFPWNVSPSTLSAFGVIVNSTTQFAASNYCCHPPPKAW